MSIVPRSRGCFDLCSPPFALLISFRRSGRCNLFARTDMPRVRNDWFGQPETSRKLLVQIQLAAKFGTAWKMNVIPTPIPYLRGSSALNYENPSFASPFQTIDEFGLSLDRRPRCAFLEHQEPLGIFPRRLEIISWHARGNLSLASAARQR